MRRNEKTEKDLQIYKMESERKFTDTKPCKNEVYELHDLHKLGIFLDEDPDDWSGWAVYQDLRVAFFNSPTLRKHIRLAWLKDDYDGEFRCAVYRVEIGGRDVPYVACFWEDGKPVLLPLGRLIYIREKGLVPKGCIVYHIDGNMTNNSPDNLGLGIPRKTAEKPLTK